MFNHEVVSLVQGVSKMSSISQLYRESERGESASTWSAGLTFAADRAHSYPRDLALNF